MKKFPCFVALDLEDEKQALSFAEKLSPFVLGFKVGPRLYFNSSSFLIKTLSSYGKVFLDFKFFDIPSTMEASVKVCFQKGVDYLTVHSASEQKALLRVAQVEKDYGGCVLAVSVLTSELADSNSVLKRAEKVNDSGLKGFVCSAYEALSVKEKFPHFFVVTPGIRFESDDISHEDQKRVATPQFALSQRADVLVIGRSLLNALDPIQKIQEVYL